MKKTTMPDLAAEHHVSRVIAGEFSIYPLRIQQRWEVNIDSSFWQE